MASTSADDSVVDESVQAAASSSVLKERTEAAEDATQKLSQELHAMMGALKSHTLESARSTQQHSAVVMRAAAGVKEAAKNIEEESMGMLKQAADLHALMSGLAELGQQAAKVRRELFNLEIDVVKLHGKAVKRMSRAASARSVRVIRAPAETELQLLDTAQSSGQPPQRSEQLGASASNGSGSKGQ